MDEPSGDLPGSIAGQFLFSFGTPTYETDQCRKGGCYWVTGSGGPGGAADSFSTVMQLPGLGGHDDVCIAFWGQLRSTVPPEFWLFTMESTGLQMGLSAQLSSEGYALYDRAQVDDNLPMVPPDKEHKTAFLDHGIGALHHFTFCEAPAVGRFIVYVDGQKTMDITSGKDLTTDGHPSTFTLVGNRGSWVINFGVPEPQLFDEIGIWNRLLSDDEVGYLQERDPFGRTYARDHEPPQVTCAAPDGAWHSTNVPISCSATDGGSGLASAGDASFVLSTSVPDGLEVADAATDSRSVCDLDGNCTTAGPIGGIKIDRKPPTISIVAPTAGTLLVGQAVASSYSCVDGGSGVSTCSGPVASGAPIDTSSVGTHAFSVTATDAVGNSATVSVTYVVAYGQCVLFDQTKAHPAGSTIPIKLQLCNAAGNNVSDASIPLVATGVYQVSNNAPGPLEDSGNANPDNQFRFAGGSYIFNLSLKGFNQGTYALVFTAGNDPTLHSVQFQLK